ncbi:hypothetical protein Ahy_A06g029670 isoform B [Arachis hypogaea]|uniref:Uncharacterized protein n=1 Tax=Arachis hypogaea TaxID=3818 RepID=A0A445CTY0_ARAHY|nr:hypothetical protein Ahy_A06g029670 isoform B [Arachis hypogaea]
MKLILRINVKSSNLSGLKNVIAWIVLLMLFILMMMNLSKVDRRSKPKTTARYMALGKVWNEILSEYSFMKENTFVTKGKHLNLLLQVGLAAWVYSPDNISMIDYVSRAIIPCQLPIDIN